VPTTTWIDTHALFQDDVDRAVGEAGERRAPFRRPVAAGEQRQPQARGLDQRPQALGVLAGQDLGRRHHGRLTPGLDRRRHGEQGHRGLARADIALE
jgi:hypothetical protein